MSKGVREGRGEARVFGGEAEVFGGEASLADGLE